MLPHFNQRGLPGDGVALVVHEVMAALAAVGVHLVHQAAHAGVDINVRVFAAHVGLHPARVQRQNRQCLLAQFFLILC